MELAASGTASREPPGPPARRAAATAPDGASNAGPLTVDGLFEVLLHIPAKELCRLRAICRPWRSLLSDPGFAAAHAARQREPLFLASHADSAECDGVVVDILDVSGRVVKRVRRTEGGVVVGMAFDLVCVKTVEGGSFRLLDPATGSVYHLPSKLAEEHLARGFKLCDYGEPVICLGRLPAQGSTRCSGCFRVDVVATVRTCLRCALSTVGARCSGGESSALQSPLYGMNGQE